MGEKGIPIDPLTVFTTADIGVFALIQYNNLRGEHKIGWKWFDPDGKLYAETRDFPVQTSPDTFVEKGSASDKMEISGTDVASHPEKWKVDIFMDDTFVASQPFDIKLIKKERSGFFKLKESVMLKVPDINFGNYYAMVIMINA